MNSYCSSLTLVLNEHFPPYIKLLTVISLFQLMPHAVSMVTFLVENGVPGRKKLADCAVQVKEGRYTENQILNLSKPINKERGGAPNVQVEYARRNPLFKGETVLNKDRCRRIIFDLMNFLGSFIGQRGVNFDTISFEMIDAKKAATGFTCGAVCNVTSIRINVAKHHTYHDFIDTAVHELAHALSTHHWEDHHGVEFAHTSILMALITLKSNHVDQRHVPGVANCDFLIGSSYC